jgi:negative regulator of flagellin synthesis FlgM
MNNIDSSTRSAFFPNSKNAVEIEKQIQRSRELKKMEDVVESDQANVIKSNKQSTDARVEIPEAIKDFSKIKMAVDQSKPLDRSEKIAQLREQIQNGTYEFDYDALAEKILTSEF